MGKIINRIHNVFSHKQNGYALPTVLAVSVIMMTILVTSLAITSTLRVAMKKQNYDRLTQLAKEAGVAYAQACIQADPGSSVNWGTNPLTPGTDCSGISINGDLDCADNDNAGLKNPDCAVLYDDENNYLTSFMVTSAEESGGQATSVSVTGVIGFIRKTPTIDDTGGTGKVWKKYTDDGGFTQTTTQSPIGWKQVSSGVNTTCAISNDDKAYCWGNNSNGQLGDDSIIESHIPIAVSTTGLLNGKKIVSISTGSTHSCAIADDNKAYCWGNNSNGRLGDGGISQSWQTRIPIAVTMPENVGFKQISAGNAHTCAISTDDKAYCWGSNNFGQLGIKSSVDSNVPVLVSGDNVLDNKTVLSIKVGNAHTCATTADKQIFCWGLNSFGQIGDGTTTSKDVPTDITNKGLIVGKVIKSLAIGPNSNHTCVIAADSTLSDQAYCWGDNANGQLGNNISGSGKKSTSPVAVYTSGAFANKTILSISVGVLNSCAIASDNKAYCWGNNLNGVLGIGSVGGSQSTPQPVSVDGVLKNISLKSLSSGGNHSCVITSNSQIYCWGTGDNTANVLVNNYGVLGNDTAVGSDKPVALTISSKLFGKTIKSISSDGYNHSCAIDSDDKTYCWGLNSNGQLGNSSIISSRIPSPVFLGTEETSSSTLFGKKISSVVVGSNSQHTCAIAQSDTSPASVFCWGSNSNGQLGNDKISSYSNVPVKVDAGDIMSGKTIKLISAGRFFSCAVSTDNQVFCWGKNDMGQLGNGINSTTQPMSLLPVKVATDDTMDDKNITLITSGLDSTCILYADDNKAYCWGYNGNKVLGNDSSNNLSYNTPIPVTVFGNKTIKSISVDSHLNCAIVDDGEDGDQAYCWGSNYNSSIGNGTTVASDVPIKVAGGDMSGVTVKSIDTNSNGACLLASDDFVYCWGSNRFGQVGNGSFSEMVTQPAKALNSSDLLKNKKISALSVGTNSSCGITKDDNLGYCWGNNTSGQLGNNTTINSSVPTPLFNSLTFLQKNELIY